MTDMINHSGSGKSFPRRKTFTLIELLVVIAILAILMAILLPSLVKAKKVVKQTVCANNLKQIGVTVGLYANDFDDFFPARTGCPIPAGTKLRNSMRFGGAWYSSTGNGGAWGDFWDSILAYFYFKEDGQTFYCPADPGGDNPGNNSTLNTRGWGISLCDYPGYRGPSYGVQYVHAYFGLTYYGPYGSTFYRGFRLQQIARYGMANLMMIADWQRTYTSIFYSQANSDRNINIFLNGSAHGRSMNYVSPDLSAHGRSIREISETDEYWMPNKLP